MMKGSATAALKTALRVCAKSPSTQVRCFGNAAFGRPVIGDLLRQHTMCSCATCVPISRQFSSGQDKSNELKSALERNRELEEELQRLKDTSAAPPSSTAAFTMHQIEKDDPDIAKLLKNNQKWVETQLVTYFIVFIHNCLPKLNTTEK
jgi:hypothetical protein